MNGNGNREDFTPLAIAFMEVPGDEYIFEVERSTLAHGRTFSESAMTDLGQLIMLFITTRVARRWEAAHEPPSAMRVTVKVDVA